jgi:hypothetical protein
LNPVTLGLTVEAYAYLAIADPENASRYRARAQFCIEVLKWLRSPGYSGSCWGYDFPWESCWGKLDAYTRTIVATGIITNGLFNAYGLLGIGERSIYARARPISSCATSSAQLHPMAHFAGATFLEIGSR